MFKINTSNIISIHNEGLDIIIITTLGIYTLSFKSKTGVTQNMEIIGYLGNTTVTLTPKSVQYTSKDAVYIYKQ